jgi:hypothetical protein
VNRRSAIQDSNLIDGTPHASYNPRNTSGTNTVNEGFPRRALLKIVSDQIFPGRPPQRTGLQ